MPATSTLFKHRTLIGAAVAVVCLVVLLAGGEKVIGGSATSARPGKSLRPVGAAEAGAIVSGEQQFCSGLKAFAEPVLGNAFAMALHAGQGGPSAPPYWLMWPLRDVAQWAHFGDGYPPNGFETGMSRFQAYLSGTPQDAIALDIGGHFGLTVMPLASTGRSVITFEPFPGNQRVLQAAVCVNAFHDRVRLVRAAVGRQDGSVTLFVPHGRGDNAALSKDASTANVGGQADPLTVPLLTLDSFMDRHLTPEEVGRIAFIKMDVQGQEGNVIKGGKRLLSSLKSGTWVVAEHDPKLIGATIATGQLPQEGGATMDIEGMRAAGYTVHAKHHGPEVPEEQWRKEPPPEGDWWYRKR